MNPDLARRLGDVLRGEQDRALGRRAVRAGFLSEKEYDDLIRRQESIEAFLRGRGVAEDDLRRLRTEIDREDFALFRPERRAPAEVLAVEHEPDRRLAEFVLVHRLGQGGIGEVWKAWDLRLGRWVAIKLPRATPDQEGASRRFTREALAAARLSHPNIVSIYRVAEEHGRSFIVMQYVEGRTLGAARPPLRQALAILRDVALAVHHAHEQGVVHRDLKPGNIMIAPDGRPFVLDFGLAHLEEAAGPHSREGLVAGTAAYMSPEQARGGPAARGRSTDIYSLGATLYEAVTGCPPFEGGSFPEILQKVLQEEPRPPRSAVAGVPRDVETVILKAMEKEASRRYATVLDFAEDLDRCLADEPIAARRPSAVDRARRWMRRSPKAAIALAAAGVLALVVGAFLLSRSREIESRRRAIREPWVASLEAMLDLRRAGANDRMEERLPRLESAYREALAVGEDLPEIDYLMGRIQRALMNDARALEFQARALEKEPGYPPALYERILLSPAAGGLEADCERLAAALSRAPEGAVRLGPGHPWAARGIVAYRRGQVARAREYLEKAIAADPLIEEAWETLGHATLEGVTAYAPPGDQETAYARAEEVFGQGIARDKGYAPLWVGRGRARLARALLRRQTGREPEGDFQAAEDDFTQGLRLRPSAFAYRARAALRAAVGVDRMELGGNPHQDFADAEADLEQALALDPADTAARLQRGAVRLHRARFRVERGGAPEDDLRAGHEDLRRALEVDASLSEAWLIRALLSGTRALGRIAARADPQDDFARVWGFFGEALRRAPEAPEALERRAFFRLEWAKWRSAAGQDSSEDLLAAEKDVGKALGRGVFFNRARVTRAAILRARGFLDLKAGRDPSTLFGEARTALAEILQTNPLSTAAWIEQGHLELDWGRHRLEKSDKAAARDHFTQAIRSYEEALRLNPFIPGKLREPVREARRGLLATY